MKKYLLSITVLIILFLFSCTGQYSPMNTKYPSMDDYLVSMNLKTTENHDVIVCSGYNCNTITQINFSEDDIYDIKKIFKEVNGRTPYIERQMISAAIATMEVITGDIVGTKNDKGGVLENEFIGNPEKQDCVDESASSTSYLLFLQKNKLIFLHDIVVPQSRGALIDGRWPHYTAVINEKLSKKQYVVDSWYRDNGHPPIIIELKKWMYDWRKSNSVINEQLS
jgi:hypothetical protein